MTDQVERKKSYRWVSASRANYDGADWDSSSDDDDNENIYQDNNHIERSPGSIVSHHLPTLPKLNYGNEEQDQEQEQEEEQRIQDNVEHLKTEKSVQKQVPVIDTDRLSVNGSVLNTPTFNDSNFRTSTNSVRKSPTRNINGDLDNLMQEISRELTPVIQQEETFDIKDNKKQDTVVEVTANTHPYNNNNNNNNGNYKSKSDTLDDSDNFVSAEASQSPYLETKPEIGTVGEKESNETYRYSRIDSDNSSTNGYGAVSDSNSFNHSVNDDNSDDEDDDMRSLHVSKAGYFQAYMNSNEDTLEKDSNEIIHEGNIVREVENSISAADDNGTENNHDNNQHITEDQQEINNIPSVPKLKHTSRTELAYVSSVENFNKEEDALSFTTSIGYEDNDDDDDANREMNSTDKVGSKDSHRKQEPEHHSKSTEPQGDDDGNNTENSENSIDNGNGNDDYDENDYSTLRAAKSGYINKIVEGISDNTSTSANDSQDNSEDDEEIGSSGQQSIITSADRDDKRKSNFIERFSDGSNSKGNLESTEENVEENSKEIGKESMNKDVNDDDNVLENNGQDATVKPSPSVNLGKWKPDTASSRSGFVQETADKKAPPPGFVVDEDGNLVDLTPSTMKPRVVSTYSEMESAWNMFPSSGDAADIETIGDTKTIYDNNTIYNVPGIIGQNQNLPPLPTSIKANDTNIVTQTDPRPLEKRQPSISQSVLSSSTRTTRITVPDSNAIASINGVTKMPQLNTTKVISSKSSHQSKLNELSDYYMSLSEYETGIQTWVSYSLKTLSNDDRDSIFEDYKQSRHVKEAYANAEEVSKKHSVTKTVVSVNQNVSHLRKKVLQRTIKPKTLFSSISKGVKL